jgi:hypothetical protein
MSYRHVREHAYEFARVLIRFLFTRTRTHTQAGHARAVHLPTCTRICGTDCTHSDQCIFVVSDPWLGTRRRIFALKLNGLNGLNAFTSGRAGRFQL